MVSTIPFGLKGWLPIQARPPRFITTSPSAEPGRVTHYTITTTLLDATPLSNKYEEIDQTLDLSSRFNEPSTRPEWRFVPEGYPHGILGLPPLGMAGETRLIPLRGTI
jgi:hypothetical protein